MNIESPLPTKLNLTSGTYSQTPHVSEINIVSVPVGNSELCPPSTRIPCLSAPTQALRVSQLYDLDRTQRPAQVLPHFSVYAHVHTLHLSQ